MKLLPYDRFEIEVPGALSDVVATLRAQVVPKSFLPVVSSRSAFQGDVSETGFVVRPLAGAHLPFLPELHGELVQNGNAVRVTVQHVPNTAVLLFITAVFGLLCMLIFNEGATVFATAAASTVVAWFLSVCGFWLDGGRSQEKLEKVFRSSPREADVVDALRAPHVE